MDDYFREHILDLLKDEYKKNGGKVKMSDLIDSFRFFKLSTVEIQSLLEWAEDL